MTPELRAVARRQAGCFTHGQAARCGLRDAAIQSRLLEGEWIALFSDVYVCAGTPVTQEMHAWAAVLAMRAPVALAGCSAALVYRLEGAPAPVRPQLVVPRRHEPRPLPGVDVRRVVDDHWSVVRYRGLPLTPIPMTIRDLAAQVGHECARDVVQHALRRRRVTFEGLAGTLGRGFSGSAALRRVLEEVGPGFQVKWERMVHRAVLAEGVRMRPQTPVRAADGRKAFIDLGLEEIGYGVEIDGFLNHMARFAADRRRGRMLAVELGWTIAPYAVEEIATDLRGVAREIAADVRRLRRERSA